MFHYLDYVQMPVFVLEPDDEGIPRYVFINAACRAYDGVSADVFSGKTVLDVFSGTGAKIAYVRQIRCFETGEPDTYDVELDNSAAKKRFRTHLEPEISPGGKVERIFGTSMDISPCNDTGSLLCGNVAEHSQMEQFVTLAAHDLRAPMRNVKLLTEMLRENFEDHGDGKLELMDLLEDVARKSSHLISEVLEHSLTAHIEGTSTRFDFEILCSEIRDILDPRRLHAFEWKGMPIETDKMVVQIVLRNLVENALKHGGADHLNISLDVSAGTDNTLTFTVTDDGNGMENPSYAFIDSGNIRVESGYGLLGIRRLLTARSGNISAHRNPESRGTCIRFVLPGSIATPLEPRNHIIEHAAGNTPQ